MKNYIELFDSSIYRFHSKNNILESHHLGICTDISSLRTPYYSVAAIECFQGCPYSDTGFKFDLIIDGERKIRPLEWTWLPNAILRRGETDAFHIETVTAVIPGRRSFILKVSCTSKVDEVITVPLQLAYRSNPSKEDYWDFSGPLPKKGKLDDYACENGVLYCKTETAE
ncbi:MAG: hypothetical protein PUB07_07290, partial [Clostridia bacterium]|nr:hypothetical protein [Clostridia bacterium]